MLFIGCGLLAVVIYTWLLPQWRVNRRFVEHSCTVLDHRIVTQDSRGNPVYRPELRVEYTVDGITYERWTYEIPSGQSSTSRELEELLVRFESGHGYPCWYDPDEPGTVVLVRGYSWWLFLLLPLPLPFIVVGLTGLMQTALDWGKSAERRAALATKVTNQEIFENLTDYSNEFPSVPSDVNLKNSPGVRFAYRLPVKNHLWRIGALLIPAVLSGIVLIVGGTAAFRGTWEGQPDWLLMFFLVLCAVAAVWLGWMLVKESRVAWAHGATCLEISDHPLVPGRNYQIFLSQSGRAPHGAVSATLVCDEHILYQQGTDTRADTHRVFQQELFRQQELALRADHPFEVAFSLNLPLDIPHSFRSAHNEIRWSIIVSLSTGDVEASERRFPVVVQPPEPALLHS